MKKSPLERAETKGTLAKIALWRYIYTGDENLLSDAYYLTREAARAGLPLVSDKPNTTAGASLIGRFGLTSDPRGAHAVFSLSGRDYIVVITDVKREESRGCWMINTRHLCGDAGPTVALSFVQLLNR